MIDKTAPDWPASIAAVGLALAAHPIAVERGFMSHPAAIERVLATLRFFWNSPQGPEAEATGYRGFYYAGSLFPHQLSHVWVDFRGIEDAVMRARGMDYFENSRRASQVQQQYAIDNPRGFAGYGRYCRGITASDGPGPQILEVDGIEREFFD